MRPAISSEKKAEMASRKKYSASTRPATVEALSGNSGVPVHILRGAWCWVLGAGCGVRGAGCGMLFPANHHENESAEREDGRDAGDSQRAHDHQAVAAGHRVVVVAVEQQRIDRIADFPR